MKENHAWQTKENKDWGPTCRLKWVDGILMQLWETTIAVDWHPVFEEWRPVEVGIKELDKPSIDEDVI